jgi:NMD protein affecting ribosome stability and mRNA decay
VQPATLNDMVCPKCGSEMTIRKIWIKLKHKNIVQCDCCKFYEEMPDDELELGGMDFQKFSEHFYN